MSDKAYTPLISLGFESQEVEIPAHNETFESQVLVKTKPYTITRFPGDFSIYSPMSEIQRILRSGHYRVELVMSSQVNGKPVLIIEEIQEQNG